jgi:poly(A) polymerase
MSLREKSRRIVRRLQAAGFQAYWVGGCVRDFLLGREPLDFDIATSARPDEVEHLFRRTVPVGRKFGVMMVVEGGDPFQVATFRTEAGYQNGRHPTEVHFSDARADALRRDFTINALFYDPIAEQLFDWVNGERDLRARQLRAIGTPAERFQEDHLRLLRAVRFAAQLNFQIDPETFTAVRENAAKIVTVSAERIRDELLKTFQPPHAARGLELLHESGLLRFVLPELVPTLDCEQSPDFHPEGTVYNHIRKMLELLPHPAPAALPWCVLLHDIAKPQTAARDLETGRIHFYGHEKLGEQMARDILSRLRFPRKQTDEIAQCVLRHMQFKDVEKMRAATLKRVLMRPTFPLELELHRLDCLGSHGRLDHYAFLVDQQRRFLDRPPLAQPLLKGDDLMGLGLEPGPEMGKLLRELRDKQLQDELTDAEAARQWAARRIAEGRGDPK